VEEAGVGAPVLLLPGLGYAAWCWREAMGGLALHRRAIALDNRGTGRSDKPPGPYSIGQLADDAAGVLDALGVPAAHVVGHSMGGYVALTLARRHPAKTLSLVLVATSAGGPQALPVPPQTLASWQSAAHLPPHEYARRTMPLSYAPGWVETHSDSFEGHLGARLKYPTPPQAWAAQFAACQAYLDEGIPPAGIHAPTLVVHGTADRVVPFENGRRLAAALPRARLVTFEGGGHLCFLEKPAEFSRLLADELTTFEEKR